MAIARCEERGRPQATKPPEYTAAHDPQGHPNSGVVCGTKGCENPAKIWLKSDEEAEYVQGVRVFDIRTNSAKVRVE